MAFFGTRMTRAASAGVTKASSVPSYGMIPPLGSVSSASGLQVSQATAMTVPTVYACVTRRAIDVARCTPRLLRLSEDGVKTYITDHPVARLLARPNLAQTWFEFIEQMHTGFLLRGNAYAAIVRNKSGDPITLIPINPDAVMVLEAEDGEWFYNVNRIGLWQMAMLRSFPVAIPAEDMLHIRGLSFNALIAASTIGLARDTIGLDMGLSQQASRFVGNGARPSGVLMTDRLLKPEAGARLKQTWNDYVSGIQNVGGTAVLEEGVKWQQLQLSSVDMQFMAQREMSVLDVCRFFRVPPHKVAVADRAASMNIPQQDQDYANNTVAPDLDRWEAIMGYALGLEDDGVKIEMDISRLLRADILTRYNSYRLGITSGFLKPNEARRAEGLPPDSAKMADELLVPSNTAALGSDMTGTGADGGGRPAGGNAPDAGLSTGGSQPGATPAGDGNGSDDSDTLGS
jgi:HK97 family phage portal protein